MKKHAIMAIAVIAVFIIAALVLWKAGHARIAVTCLGLALGGAAFLAGLGRGRDD